MTTDDRRSFFRRLFTRRLEEAAMTGPAPSDPDAAAAPRPTEPGATETPASPDASTLPPAEAGTPAPDSASTPPSTETGARGTPPSANAATAAPAPTADGDATGETVPLGATGQKASICTPDSGAGSEAAPVPAADDEAADDEAADDELPVRAGADGAGVAALIPGPRSGADDVMVVLRPAVSVVGAVNDSTSVVVLAAANETQPGGSGSPAASHESDMSVVGGGGSAPVELGRGGDSSGALGSERADGGHVPSFLDSDFDEPEDDDRVPETAPSASSPGADPAAEEPATETVAEEPATETVAETPTTAAARWTPDAATAAAASEPAADAAGEEPDAAAAGEPASAVAGGSARKAPAPRRPEIGEWRGIVLVTGTDTDVGKTIVTAAVAAAAQASGLRVAVIKPGQTGIVTGAPTDLEVVTRLAGPDTVRVLAEYPEPMAPLAAATIAEMAPLELYEVVDAVRAEADKHDLVLVEGAGGLLVPMGVRPSGEAWTFADLATTLGVPALVVARAGLGTLNHTALTLEALARRGVPAGVIIGAWPADPQLVHWANLSELVPHLVGALPDGAGRMDPGVFRRSAPGWLTPALFGVLDNWRVWAEESG